MSRPDAVVDGTRFRARAAASLDGDAGVWGDGDLMCVQVNGDGELEAADADNCDGVIWAPEGRISTFRVAEADLKKFVGGRVYTVFERAEIAEMEVGTSPALSAGDRVYSVAAGDVSTTNQAGVYLGVVVPNDVTGGLKLILRVNTWNQGS